MRIWKYELGTNRTTLQMPVGAHVLDAQVQHGGVVLWALVSPDAPKVEREFYVYMTGEMIVDTPDYLLYISTVQIQGGDFIAHVFERVGPNTALASPIRRVEASNA